jgi:hypothetical protein
MRPGPTLIYFILGPWSNITGPGLRSIGPGLIFIHCHLGPWSNKMRPGLILIYHRPGPWPNKIAPGPRETTPGPSLIDHNQTRSEIYKARSYSHLLYIGTVVQ